MTLASPPPQCHWNIKQNGMKTIEVSIVRVSCPYNYEKQTNKQKNELEKSVPAVSSCECCPRVF